MMGTEAIWLAVPGNRAKGLGGRGGAGTPQPALATGLEGRGLAYDLSTHPLAAAQEHALAMSGLPWIKWFPSDFNDGVMEMPLEEVGAYVKLLNEMYQTGGPIPDRPSFATRVLFCTPRQWTKLRQSLLTRGKIQEVTINNHPCLTNVRAMKEIENRRDKIKKLSENGSKPRKGTESVRTETGNEINEAKPAIVLPNADQMQEHMFPESSIDREEDIEEEKTEESSPNGEVPTAKPSRFALVSFKADPVREAFDAYNRMAKEAGIPTSSALNDKRRRGLKARLEEVGLDGWTQAMARVPKSPFLTGNNDRGWRAGLDFLIRPDKFQCLLEGAYEGKSNVRSAAATDNQRKRGNMVGAGVAFAHEDE